jgi:hypothetical protein
MNQVVQEQRMQAVARLSMMNAARAQQAQVTIQNQMRVSQQQRLLAEMRRQQALTKENENAGLDDPSEPTQVQRRSIQRRFKRQLKLNTFKYLPDPRGSQFMKGNLNINSNIQFQMLPQTNQNMPSNVQNSTDAPYISPPVMPADMCPVIPMAQGYQNTFNMNGRSDIKQWVYIPVKVIYQRPPTFNSYDSYPIVNGEVEAEDIYSPTAFRTMQNVMPKGKPASYSHCQAQESGAGKVYISSQGMNYMGTYKEYAVVDHRLAISVATAYVAVKSPQFGASQVFLNAYDSCGRICQPFCKLAGAQGFQRCSGAFRVTSSFPKLYGTNYGDAVTHLWQFGKNDICPTMQDDSIYIQFHCNFKESWPFGMQPQQAARGQGAAAFDEIEEPEVSKQPIVSNGPVNINPTGNINILIEQFTV